MEKFIDENTPFLHLDLDAIVMNPFLKYFKNQDFDIIAQAGGYPHDISENWNDEFHIKSALCCGIIHMKPTKVSKNFYQVNTSL